MGIIFSLESIVTKLTRIIALTGLSSMLILAAVTVAEALMRSLFNLPIIFISDISTVAITVSIAACFPIVFAQRRHVTIRILGQALGPRLSSFLEAFGSLVALGVVVFLTWHLWVYANRSAAGGESTVIAQIPIAPFFRVVTILFGLCIPIQALVFYDQIKGAITGEEIPKSDANGKDESIV